MNLCSVEYDARPAVMICADTEHGRTRCREAIDAVDARLAAMLDPVDAAERLALLPPAACVMIDVEQDGGPALDRLLAEVNAATERGAHASLVHVSPALIDVAAACLPHDDVVLLCDAGPIERAAMLGVALNRRVPLAMRETGDDTAQLRQLSEEVGRIARALAMLTAPDR